MGVHPDMFGPICGAYIGFAAVLSPLLAFYVFRSTKDSTMKKDNCWYPFILHIFRMTFWLVWLAVFCMWIMWACTFSH